MACLPILKRPPGLIRAQLHTPVSLGHVPNIRPILQASEQLDVHRGAVYASDAALGKLQVLETTHCTLYITHYTLFTAYCILHTAYYALHTTHYTLHTTNYTLHTTHCTLAGRAQGRSVRLRRRPWQAPGSLPLPQPGWRTLLQRRFGHISSSQPAVWIAATERTRGYEPFETGYEPFKTTGYDSFNTTGYGPSETPGLITSCLW